MIYHFSLSTVAIGLGLFLMATHLLPFFQWKRFEPWARAFPRSGWQGNLLMGLATIWMVTLCATMDMGEFTPMRKPIVLFFAVLGGLSIWLLRDFLAVRGLGALLLLAANVLLDAAFLHNHPWKLLVPVLAYLWIVLGIVFVCSPYLLRDGLAWVLREPWHWRGLAGAGVVFGLVLTLFGFFVY